MILAGDLGGTKSNLGVFETRSGQLDCLESKRFPSQEYARAEDIVGAFAGEADRKITAACFGVAGPVVENRVRATNLPWIVDSASLARILGISRVTLLNDLEATAYGLEFLQATDLETLHAGMSAPQGNRIVIAAGTGLGEAIVFWDGSRHVPMASEGGHADFAPRTDQEIELLRFLKSKYESVSFETILSGRGFRDIHEFLDRGAKHAGFDNPDADPAPEITHRALEGSCRVCVKTLDLWVDVYGAEAGNLALKAVARGGVYVAGGIAVKILPKLKDGRFAAAFVQKGKFAEFLSGIPIYVVKNEDAPLLGAAHVASQTQEAGK